VFPPRCAGCGTGRWPFCEACRAALEVLGPPWCERCGSPEPVSVERCRDCPPPPVSVARSPFLYAGPARAAIHRLKFSGWRSVAKALAGAMVAIDPPAADAVTWVPLARRRLAERGYDQARALADAVGGTLGLPVRRLARRSVGTAPQARRPVDERRMAMRGAFEPVRRNAADVPRRVILVDDVLTTGATVAACADVLASAGVHDIIVLTAARAFAAQGRGYTRTGSQPGLWLPGDLPR
jgi:ComF family protein